MDFGKLKLNEGVANGNLGYDATQKTSEFARTGGKEGQTGGTQQSRERQNVQKTAKVTTKQSPVVQNALTNSFDPMHELRSRKELIKMREAAKYDWRKDLMEAANPDDDPQHPFVEVMPHSDYRMKEAKKNLMKGMAQDKMQQGSVTAGMSESACDNTSTPKENAARRKVNAKPEMRAKIGKKAVERTVTNAFDN